MTLPVLKRRLRQLLDDDGVVLTDEDLTRLARVLIHSQSVRDHYRSLTPEQLPIGEIERFILEARDSGQFDEAIWRSFVATHFGSRSTRKKHHAASASRFLCAFGEQPYWTWDRVSADLSALNRWLHAQQHQLDTIRFGNHRKHESKDANALGSVIASFVSLVRDYGGSPAALLRDGMASTPEAQFDQLYQRLRPLLRFGRLGIFDFLMLLGDRQLVDAEPGSCYLSEATGPLRGAQRIWGDKPVYELDRRATQLAKALGFSPAVMQNALCIWQKS